MSLREQLVGAWELVEYYAFLADDQSNKIYPMGRDAEGIIMYTPDGYMSAQLGTSGKTEFSPPGTEADWAHIGKNYTAYTGQFYLDESGDQKGAVLVHSMRSANVPRLYGDKQRRLVKITDEDDGHRWLTLSAEPRSIGGEEKKRVPNVRWRRLPDNSKKKPPNVWNM